MLVKTCGIKSKQAAGYAVEAGTDFIGFIFAPSKRQLTPEEAATIAKTIPSSVKKVGVFVNASLEEMLQTAKEVGLDFIQLHGDEPPEIAEQLPYKIIKAFPVETKSLAMIQDYPCDYYLLDSPFGRNRGGNGTTFDWNLLKKISLDSKRILLAGGLNPENVQQAIQIVNPTGVDVSSGIETNGEKDHEKIKHFIANAKKTRKDDSIDTI
ncbi:phosphoribosylanthranilate isomerase [Virgibacillus byunsanensis]|uniref:N-(5'-phosphoribosyl)anthranilate isomerase n=1 Tax=Virgibacillus byunsanensis TaxID=570945 RepID=A0ABW3LLU0_9BACI